MIALVKKIVTLWSLIKLGIQKILDALQIDIGTTRVWKIRQGSSGKKNAKAYSAPMNLYFHKKMPLPGGRVMFRKNRDVYIFRDIHVCRTGKRILFLGYEFWY